MAPAHQRGALRAGRVIVAEVQLAQIAGDTEQYYANELQPLKLKGYVAYLEERSWRSDLKMLLKTIAAVVVPGNDSWLREGTNSREAEIAEGSHRDRPFSEKRPG